MTNKEKLDVLIDMLYREECDSAWWIDPPDEATIAAQQRYEALKWATERLKKIVDRK